MKLNFCLIALSFGAALSAHADIPAQLATQVKSGLTRGTALGIVTLGKDDQVITVGDVTSKSSLLEIGSISKSFAGIVTAELSLEGKLNLEAPISNYLPELAGTYAGTTTAHLLGIHSARLPDAFTYPNGNFSTLENDADIINFLKSFTPIIPAGTRSYSNLGFDVLSVLIERITGKDYRQNLTERIFNPLQMSQSLFITSATAPNGLLQGYGVLLDPLPYRPFSDPECAPGGIASTLHDMLIYLKANINADASPLGQAMALSQKLGLGWDSDPGVTLIWKNGAMDSGFSSLIEFDPVKKTGVIALTNDMDSIATDDLAKEQLNDTSWRYLDLPSTTQFVASVAGIYKSVDDSMEVEILPVSGNYLGVETTKPIPPADQPIGWYRNRLMTSDQSTYWVQDGSSYTDKIQFTPSSSQAIYFSYTGKDAAGNPTFRQIPLVKK